MMSGFSQSGKSTLSKKIMEEFPEFFNRIDADSIHDFLNKTYPAFQDDNTIEGRSFQLRQQATTAIRAALIELLIRNGNSIIFDSCNAIKNKRNAILAKVKEINKNIKTVIVYIKISEEQLISNLKKADCKKIENGEKPAWVDLYEKIQKKEFEEPQESEADRFIIFDGDNFE